MLIVECDCLQQLTIYIKSAAHLAKKDLFGLRYVYLPVLLHRI